MRITLVHLVCAGAAAVLLCAGPSLAASTGTIWLTFVKDDPTRIGQMHGNNAPAGSFYIGRSVFDVVHDADPLHAPAGDGAVLKNSAFMNDPQWELYGYCVDIEQLIRGGYTDQWEIHPLAEAPMGGGATAMGPVRAEALGKLFAKYLPKALTLTADNCAAFAACVWEIINETTGKPYSLSNDDFKVTQGSGVTDWITTGNTWLSDLVNLVVVEDDLHAIVNTSTQDFLVLIPGVPGNPPVPEPLTLGMGFLAVAGMGLYIRKHTKKPATA